MQAEKIRIFPQTKEAITSRLEQLQSQLKSNSDGMSDMGGDGDQMDDPYMFKLHEEREHLEKESRRLQTYLSSDIEVLGITSVDEGTGVMVGHDVTLDIVYPDGESERITVTLGSSVDKVYLGTNDIFVLEEWKTFFCYTNRV